MFWELHQQRLIGRAQSAATRAAGKADRVQVQISLLEDKLDSLSLICQSMWELLSESVPDAEQRLERKVEEVDLRDGQLDGKMNRVQRECTNCRRALHKRHRRCMYCGHEMEGENIFQK